MQKTRSFTSLLVIGATILHLILTPTLFSGILFYLKNTYSEQFIDNTRASTNLISSQLSQYNFSEESEEIRMYLDELLLGGQINHAELHLDTGEILTPLELMQFAPSFKEDFFFNEHGDSTYFIRSQISDHHSGASGYLFLGYDESLTQEHIDTFIETGLYAATGYLLITILALLFLIPKSTSVLKLIKRSARRIAEGNSSETLNIQSRITEFSSLAKDLEIMRLELISQKDAIEAREAYISAIMDKMAEPMIILNSDLSIHSLNPAAEDIFGYFQSELVSHNFLTLISPGCDSDGCRDIPSQVKQKTPKPSQCTGKRKNGSQFPVEFHYSMLTYGDQDLIICNAHDMTTHKQHENELIEARSAAESANKSKSIFLSSMSHELRTPLNAIIGYSEILLEEAQDNNDEVTANDLTKIRNSGTHLLSLINNILDLSKIEAGKMDLDPSNFEIAHMIEDVKFTISPLIDKNNNTFIYANNAQTKDLYADYTKIKQILINLIGNAAKFTEEGTITLEVSDAVYDEKDSVSLVIRDTGIGIAAEDQTKLFEEFSQANSSVSTNYGGTGLGLAISKKFSQMMGGDITFKSELGKGTEFTVMIPVQSEENPLQSNQNAS